MIAQDGLISKDFSAYLSKANDSVGVIVGRYDDSHLTTKSNLSPALWILQADHEVLLLFGNVVVDDVDGYLQLAVARCEVQLTETGRKKKRRAKISVTFRFPSGILPKSQNQSRYLGMKSD